MGCGGPIDSTNYTAEQLAYFKGISKNKHGTSAPRVVADRAKDWALLRKDANRFADAFADGWVPLQQRDTDRLVDVLRALTTTQRRLKMTFTSEQIVEFETLARPLMKFLAEDCNPHTTVILDSAQAEIVAGVAAFSTDDYIKE